MQYSVYILYSKAFDKFYVGQTKDVNARLLRHNRGTEKFTAPFAPWTLMLTLSKPARSEAMVLERKLKNLSKIRLREFIQKYAQAETTPP